MKTSFLFSRRKACPLNPYSGMKAEIPLLMENVPYGICATTREPDACLTIQLIPHEQDAKIQSTNYGLTAGVLSGGTESAGAACETDGSNIKPLPSAELHGPDACCHKQYLFREQGIVI
jgi:hypothetical protein